MQPLKVCSLRSARRYPPYQNGLPLCVKSLRSVLEVPLTSKQFSRRRRNKANSNLPLLQSLLTGLSLDDPTILDEDDAFGPLGLCTLFSSSQPSSTSYLFMDYTEAPERLGASAKACIISGQKNGSPETQASSMHASIASDTGQTG